MADGGSPIHFPSPSTILGKHTDSAPPPPPPPPLPEPQYRKKDTNHARRPSKDNTKKNAAPRKAAPLSEPKDAIGAAKPKQTKSRNGCITCKTKRLKCGEEKPGCQNCAKRKVPCGGYKKNFQWRDYSNPEYKTNAERPHIKGSSPTHQTSADSSKVTTPSTEFPPSLLAGAGAQRPQTEQHGSDKKSPSKDEQHPSSSPAQQQTLDRPSSKNAGKRDSVLTLPTAQRHGPPPLPTSPEEEHYRVQDEFSSVSFNPDAVFTFRSRSLSPARPLPGTTPTLTEYLFSDALVDSDFRQDFVPFSMPEDMHLPLWSADAENPHLPKADLIHDGDELGGRPDPVYDQALLWPSQHITSPLSSASSGTPNTGHMPLSDPTTQLYMQPEFSTESMEHLAMLFDRETCGVLSIMDGPTENPWRSVIWPMAQSSLALRHALFAMTAYHQAQQHRSFKRIGHEHKQASFYNIQEGIREHTMSDPTALATALTLAFAESWDRQIESGHAHIKGAQILVKRILVEQRLNRRLGTRQKVLKFLCNAWVYMDVIARLTCVDDDLSNDFDINSFSEPDAPQSFTGNGRAKEDGFGINFGIPVDSRLDPLMGCAGTLFPHIGRVANVIRKVCRSFNNSPWIVSTARDLKTSLDDWEPPEEIDRPEDPSTKTQHAVQTAEAFRLATLLHLHSAVPELPSSSSADLARKVLAALATIPMSSRTVVVQMFPLLAAGCEVYEPDDRLWVRSRWQAMRDRMHIGVTDKCLAVTEEVWRRRDIYEARPINNRKLVKTLELVAATQNGAPLSPGGSSIDPATVGVVYSWVDTESELKGISPLKDINGSEAARFKKDILDRVRVDPAYSVRGHLHWVGVCSAWDFELLLA